jgi:DNA (cytosine-5)-methyltransferase 1
MIYGSVCSGIEAASVAWHPLGWKASFVSEIDKFPRAVLAHHYPEVPLHGDFTTIQDGQYEPIDLLVGGTPCQSFSVAGLRGGLDDDRGNLALEFLKLAQRLRPRWVVWENVPGVLSSNGGRDFGSILAGLGEVGYGFAYRVLDAQYFGLAQRRKRVFVVGYLGDWRRAASVLFEREGLRGDTAPSREKGEGSASGFEVGPTNSSGPSVAFAINTSDGVPRLSNITATLDCAGTTGRGSSQRIDVLNFDTTQITSPQNGSNPKPGDPCHPITAQGHVPAVAFDWQMGAKARSIAINEEQSPTLSTQADRIAVAFAQNTRDEVREMAVVGALAANPGMKQTSFIRQASAVRRLTPTECERLQGFPDGYTLIPYRGKPAADGPRYKALGNSMAVPCMRWIGERIQMVEDLPC